MARIGLTQLPRRVQEHVQQRHGVAANAPSYRKCFDGAVGNRFPAIFSNHRWTVEDTPASLDEIAVALGMAAAPAEQAA